MKIMTLILGLVIVAIILCFALSNQQGVALEMWPFDGALQIPLYICALIPLIFGFLMGLSLGWLVHIPHRLRIRRLHKELLTLNDKIDDLQKSSLTTDGQTTRKKYFWQRNKFSR